MEKSQECSAFSNINKKLLQGCPGDFPKVQTSHEFHVNSENRFHIQVSCDFKPNHSE